VRGVGAGGRPSQVAARAVVPAVAQAAAVWRRRGGGFGGVPLPPGPARFRQREQQWRQRGTGREPPRRAGTGGFGPGSPVSTAVATVAVWAATQCGFRHAGRGFGGGGFGGGGRGAPGGSSGFGGRGRAARVSVAVPGAGRGWRCWAVRFRPGPAGRPVGANSSSAAGARAARRGGAEESHWAVAWPAPEKGRRAGRHGAAPAVWAPAGQRARPTRNTSAPRLGGDPDSIFGTDERTVPGDRRLNRPVSTTTARRVIHNVLLAPPDGSHSKWLSTVWMVWCTGCEVGISTRSVV